MFGFIDPLYAQQAAAPGGTQGFLMNLAPIMLIMVLGYFLFIMPAKKREKKHQELVNALKRGDRIITSGGIFGTVSKVINDQEMEIEISDNVKIRILKTMISHVVAKTEPSKPEAVEAAANKSEKSSKPLKKPSIVKKK
ncbi:MAG: preprotein translocase subunit YajC [Candidatus Nucleicultricaceae bacterium]